MTRSLRRRYCGAVPIAELAQGQVAHAVPRLDVAVGQLGAVQIELIEQRDDTPSPYRDFLAERGPGLHHMAAWSADYEADLARLAGLGHRPDCTAEVSGIARLSYFGTGRRDGTVVELTDVGTSDTLLQLSELVSAAAASWDGTEPVRPLPG
jgi:glyoxalase/bleomycin resistance protein/dioxygenase superfamily protein